MAFSTNGRPVKCGICRKETSLSGTTEESLFADINYMEMCLALRTAVSERNLAVDEQLLMAESSTTAIVQRDHAVDQLN
jgi:hypothetical protein